MSAIAAYDGLVVFLDTLVDPATGELTPSGSTFLKKVRKANVPVGWISTSPLKTPEDWAAQLATAKLDVAPATVITSTTALLHALEIAGTSSCMVVGRGPLRDALSNADVELTDDPTKAQAVALGFTTDINGDDLRAAMSAVLSGARLIATDLESRLVDAQGVVWPSTGATAAFLRAATDIAAEVVGGASRDLYELVAQRAGLSGSVLAINGRVATDLRGATKLGWDTAFIVGDSWVRLIDSPIAPTWAVAAVDDLVGEMPSRIAGANADQMDAVHDLLLDAIDVTERGQFDFSPTTTLVALAPDGSDGERVVGATSWETTDNAAHLHAVAVEPAERRLGTGSHLVASALSKLRADGVEWVYLSATGGDDFFATLGFWPVAADRVPEAIATAVGGLGDDRRALVRRLR